MTEKNNDVPMIEEHRVESSIVHASKMSRNATIISVCATVVAIIAIASNVFIVNIFTSKYNERTSSWIDAFVWMAERLNVPEVTDETVQQFAPP